MQSEIGHVEKQATGFKFGKYSLKVLKVIGETIYNGRTYRLLLVQTQEGLEYYAWRLYNTRNRFIKQFLFEPQVLPELSALLKAAQS